MATIAELKIIVDSSQVEKAKKDLASLGEAATKVGASTKGFSDGMKNATDSSDEFSGAAQRLIARAKEMEATVGASKGGLLNYKASILGVADVVKPLATSLDTLTIAQKNQDAVTKEVARNQAVADTAKYKMIEALKEEIALYGKSKNEIALYRAEQLGIIDSVRPLVEELNRLKDAREGADKAGKSGADERISKKQQELEALKLEGAELQKNSALIGEKANAEARIAEQQKAVEANRVKYESKQQEIAELRGVAEGERLLAEEKKKVVQSTEAERAAFLKLRGEIDPVKKQMETYYQQLEKIQELRNKKVSGKGGADLGELAELEKAVKSNIDRMQTLGSTSGKTAKEIAFSMRGLPAQFTDIAVSLQGGQAPLTVMLQQGGQLKDMFGGIIPALKAMGGYVLSLINPFTILITTVGALSLAFYQGASEASAFRKTLLLSGNAAGTSTKQLTDSARSIAESYGTIGASAEVLNKLVANTKVHKDSLEDVAKATLKFSDATGVAMDDLLGDFDSLATDPVAAIEKLQDKYSFLTKAVVDNAREQRELGNVAGEIKILTEALADSMDNTATIIIASMNPVQRLFKDLKVAAAEAWDVIKNGGRVMADSGKETEEAIRSNIASQKQVVAQLTKARDLAKLYPIYLVAAEAALQNQVKALDDMEKGLVAVVERNQEIAEAPYLKTQEQFNKRNIASQSELVKSKQTLLELEAQYKIQNERGFKTERDKQEAGKAILDVKRKIFDLEKNQSGAKRLKAEQDALEAAKERFSGEQKAGALQLAHLKKVQEFQDLENKKKAVGLSLDEQSLLDNKEQVLSLSAQGVEMEKNFAAQKKAAAQAKKNSVVRDDAATKLLLSLSQQEASLREQLVTDSKLGQQAQEFAKMDVMFADLKEKAVSGRLTLEQQSLLNSEAEIRAQRTILVDLEAQNRAKADGVKIDAYRANLANKLESDKDKSVDFTATRGVSDKEAGRLKEINELSRERNELDRDSARLLAETGNTDVYDKQIKANAEYYKERKKNLKEYYELEDEAQQDWQGGMQAGFANFIESQADMYSSMSELTQNTLSTLADGVSESLTQAILYGEDLRTSLSNLARTITEQLLKGLIDVGIQFAINAAKEAAAVTAVGAAKQAVITSTAAVANTATVTTTATQTAAGASTAAAWSPAALAASIGSFGTAAAIGLAAVVATMAAFGGFRKGGYTGNMGVDDVAGVVHGKEYVFDAAATSRIGINNLESLRSGGGISSDFISSGSRSGGGRSGGTVNQTINVQGTVDRQTANQIARRSAQKQSIAEARLG